MDLSPEPDLHPLYPTSAYITHSLSPHSGLAPSQKAELVSHCLIRSCIFGELSVLTYLLTDRQAQTYIDLGIQDDDGLGLVSLTIHGFGSESERDVEREECVRLLIAQGADVNAADRAGWTPLHHAAILSPPTLISHLMTHGCSPFLVTRRNLTALDIVTAHSILPGREDVALLLEEAMRGEGWTGGRMEERRRLIDRRIRQKGKQKNVREDVAKVLGVNPKWWGNEDSDCSSTESDLDEDEEIDENVYTPKADYASMLVFSPHDLPQIFNSLITNFPPSFRNSQPATTLYLLARFACLACDHTWLEDLIMGATDAIEATFFSRADDITYLVFWLYNSTLWLHLLQCDTSINEACDMLGSFDVIEEMMNSLFVFIIRFAERKIDQLLDAALLDHVPLASEFDSVQFESEWTFFKSLAGKKKPPNINVPSSGSSARGVSTPSSPPLFASRPPSPAHMQPPISSSASKSFASLRQSFARARAPSTIPLQSLFPDASPQPSPEDITSFLTALHTFLTLSGVNPVLITQLWSQVMYWSSCEMFNRILTRKKYICRSRAVQIGINLSVLEEWVGRMALPPGVRSHFSPVRDLLNWLQCLSSISEFQDLIATIQMMKSINPLQMRRAVRDYRYEIDEGRMTEECIQYLTQLQKDWERHRVKLGVEALRKEFGEREREREESDSSFMNNSSHASAQTPSVSTVSSSESSAAQRNIDMLFDRTQSKSTWEPAKPPQVLGELLDSRYMLPLLLPSDPRMLSALPGKFAENLGNKRSSPQFMTEGRSTSRASTGSRGSMAWRTRNRKIRDVGVETLLWVDGRRSAVRWNRPVEGDEFNDEDDISLSDSSEGQGAKAEPHLTRKPSARSRGRPSQGGDMAPAEPLCA